VNRFAIRLLVVLTLILGVNYIAWRWLESLNWTAWWIAVPLVLAETYSLIDVGLFGMTVWRLNSARPPRLRRPAPRWTFLSPPTTSRWIWS
jgi:cellulose synthase (UDP-forming)